MLIPLSEIFLQESVSVSCKIDFKDITGATQLKVCLKISHSKTFVFEKLCIVEFVMFGRWILASISSHIDRYLLYMSSVSQLFYYTLYPQC